MKIEREFANTVGGADQEGTTTVPEYFGRQLTRASRAQVHNQEVQAFYKRNDAKSRKRSKNSNSFTFFLLRKFG